MKDIALFVASLAFGLLTTAAGMFLRVQTLALSGGGLLILATALGIVAYRRRKRMTEDSEWGDDNTLYGNVSPPKKMGSGNTIVGATDDRGNTIIRTGTSVGAGAGFDPSGVIIGSGAGANLGGRKPKSK